MSSAAPRAAESPLPVWYDRPQFLRLALLVAAVFLLVEGVFAVGFKENDFLGHVREGERLWAHGTRALVWDWYPLGRQLWNAGLATLTPRGARLFCYLLSIAAAYGLFRMLRTMAGRHDPASLGLDAAAFGLASMACFTFLRRDLDECGLHLLLATMLTAAAFGLYRARPLASGLWLALAISYKSTPLLFLPVLVWKRQWRACAATLGFLTVLNLLLPAALLGWGPTLDYHRRFVARAHEFASQRDPSAHVVEPPKYLNQSLKSALARLVQTYPPGHSLHLTHPAFVQFLDLDVDTARRAVTLGMLAIVAAIGWPLRRTRFGDGPREGNLLHEWTALCVVATLLSPFCWKQHLVAALPAVYLVIRRVLLDRQALAGGRPPLLSPRGLRLRTAGLWLFAGLTLLTARGLLNVTWSELMLSYKVYTWAGLLAIGLLLSLPRSTQTAAATLPNATPLRLAA